MFPHEPHEAAALVRAWAEEFISGPAKGLARPTAGPRRASPPALQPPMRLISRRPPGRASSAALSRWLAGF